MRRNGLATDMSNTFNSQIADKGGGAATCLTRLARRDRNRWQPADGLHVKALP
mgnify:CR=1|jgi:hypothetical protein